MKGQAQGSWEGKEGKWADPDQVLPGDSVEVSGALR